MTDAELVQRLRNKTRDSILKENDRMEAADHIETMTAERDRLRDALTRLLEPYGDDPCYYDHHGYCQAHFVEADCCVAYARAALKGETQ